MRLSENKHDGIDKPEVFLPPYRPEESECPCRVTPMKWLLLPYIVGLLWLSLHPIVSIMTGELKCRGFFVDEKAMLQSSYFSTPYPFDQLQRYYSNTNEAPAGGLCHTLAASGLLQTNMIECYHDEANDFDYATIVPNNAPSLSDEAIILIVNGPRCDAEWASSYFHVALLSMMDRLSDGLSSPWLSKNIIIVSPSPSLSCKVESSEKWFHLNTIVSTFADAYHLGLLPMQHITSTIRNVLVIDVAQPIRPKQTRKRSMDVYILPQGFGSMLPNFDLVSVIVEIFMHQNWSASQNIRLHLYPPVELIQKLHNFLEERFPTALATYFKDLISMFTFAGFLTFGPYVILSVYSPAC